MEEGCRSALCVRRKAARRSLGVWVCGNFFTFRSSWKSQKIPHSLSPDHSPTSPAVSKHWRIFLDSDTVGSHTVAARRTPGFSAGGRSRLTSSCLASFSASANVSGIGESFLSQASLL